MLIWVGLWYNFFSKKIQAFTSFFVVIGAFVAMPPTQWSQCCEGISNALCLLKEEKDCYFPFLVGEYDDEEANNDEQRTISEAEHDAVVASGAALASTSALLKARQKQHTQGDSKEGKAMLETALTLTRFLERLDDELVKALQLTDIHSEVSLDCYETTVNL